MATSPEKNNNSHGKKNGQRLIFVVDDEPMLLELASVILSPLGFTIKSFRDPQSALKAFAEADPPPDLVLTDYAMHTMNGMDLIAACRKLQPRQRILLLSGTVDHHIFRNSPQKPDLFLAKPYHAKQLIDAVNLLLKTA